MFIGFNFQSAVCKEWEFSSPLLKMGNFEIFSLSKLEGYFITSTLEKSKVKGSHPCLWESIYGGVEKYFESYLVNEHQGSCVLGETGGPWKKLDQIGNKRHIT